MTTESTEKVDDYVGDHDRDIWRHRRSESSVKENYSNHKSSWHN